MELVDVLTADGRATGETKPKAHVHRDGDWHRSAHLWIVPRPGHVLLQKRAAVKENHPGLWDVSVAGHLSAGESAVQAVIREAAEEIGIILAESDVRQIGTVVESHVLNSGRYIENEFHEIFVAKRSIDLQSLQLQPGEVDDVAIVPLGDLLTRSDLVPHQCEYEMVVAELGT